MPCGFRQETYLSLFETYDPQGHNLIKLIDNEELSTTLLKKEKLYRLCPGIREKTVITYFFHK